MASAKPHRWTWLALLALVSAGALLRSEHMTDVTSRSPDERVYTYYAARLVDGGIPAYREAVREYNADPGSWFYPAPTRVGFVALSAAVMRVTGVRNPRAGAAVSWFFGILSTILLAWMGMRFFPAGAALVSVAFLVFSFSELGMGRRAWQDSTFGFLGLLLIYLSSEILRAPRRYLLYAAFFAAGTFSLLIKETAWLSYGLCGVWTAGVLALRHRSWKAVAVLAAGGAASVAIAFAAWDLMAGGLAPAFAAIGHLLQAAEASPYARVYYSGPWYQFFYLLWITGPLTAAMALAGLYAVVKRPSAVDRDASYLAALLTLVFFGLAAFGPQLQNLRIVSPADGSYALLAGLGLWYLVSLAGQRRIIIALAAAGMTLASLRDYRTFVEVAVHAGIQDLSVKMIRDSLGR